MRNYRGLHPQLRAATLDWRTGSSPGRARSRAWGCLPVRVHFDTDKHVGRTTGTAYGEPVTTGYEIHHGVAALTVPGAAQPFLDGYRLGAVWGTTWRGAWKSDGFRRAFLRDVADLSGRDFAPAPDVELAAVRAEHLDPLGDLVADHLDIAVTVCVRSWLTRNSRHALRPAFRAPWCPGCSSAIAAPRLAGVPVTSRGIAHEFTVASGHLPPGHPDSLVDWPALARLRGTLVLLMAVRNAPKIAGVLVEHGRPENTPVVVVQSAGTDRQRRLTGRLDGLAALMEVEDVRPPTTIVIGRWPLRQTRRSRCRPQVAREIPCRHRPSSERPSEETRKRSEPCTLLRGSCRRGTRRPGRWWRRRSSSTGRERS